MQITIDTAVDSPESIRNAVTLLLIHTGDIAAGTDSTPVVAVGPLSETEAERCFGPLPPIPPSIPPPPPIPGANVEIEIPAPPSPPVPDAGTVQGSTSGLAASSSAGTTGGVPSTAAPAAAAAADPSAAAAPTTSHSELDSAGLPWDARIHQVKRSKKQDGTWKIKKNCSPVLVMSVVQELSACKPPAASVSLPPPAAQSTGGVPMPPGIPAAPAAAVSIPAPPASMSAASSAAPGPVSGPSFRDIVSKFTTATKSGQLKHEDVQTICQQAGAPSLGSLLATPHLIPQVDALLDAALLGK
jgi:hypothetical protein